jgi:translation initiation factor 2 gamma subunit (eIF-2gamma)
MGIKIGYTELFIYECLECKACEPLYCLNEFCNGGFKILNKSMRDVLIEELGETDFKPLKHNDLSKYI